MKKLFLALLTLLSFNAFSQETFHTNTVIQDDGSIYFLNYGYALTSTTLTLQGKESSQTLDLIKVSDEQSGGVRTRVFKVKGSSNQYEIINVDNCYIINWYGEIFRNDPKEYLSFYDEDCIPKKLKKRLKNQRMYLGKPYKW